MAVANKMTVPDFQSLKARRRIAMVTAYDYPTAVIADRGGVDALLVGDTAANVIHGMQTTLEFALEDVVSHAQAVRRAQPRALVVVDMPWLTYHFSEVEAIRNAGRLVQEGGAEAVKLEGGKKRAGTIEAIIGAEIPVMGHIGLTPQSYHAMGGFKVQAQTLKQVAELLDDAKAVEDSGCFAVVVEGVPAIVGRLIAEKLSIPTIGIGAGPHTDGQILVLHDLLGMTFGRTPSFVREYARLGTDAVDAVNRYVTDVKSRSFPDDSESYHVSKEVEDAIGKRYRT